MSFFLLILLMLFTAFCGLVGQGTNNAAAVCAVLFFPSSLALYFWPAGLAFYRGHQNKVSVAVLNLFLGWTFLGWVIALVWAYKREAPIPPAAAPVTFRPYERPSPVPAWKPQDPETKRCPFCAEDIKFSAIKCKHCGSDLAGNSAQATT